MFIDHAKMKYLHLLLIIWKSVFSSLFSQRQFFVNASPTRSCWRFSDDDIYDWVLHEKFNLIDWKWKIHRFHLVFFLSLTFFTFPSILKIHIVNLVYNYSNANELYQHLNTSRLHLSIWLGFGLIWLDLTWLHSVHIVNLINLFICLSLF